MSGSEQTLAKVSGSLRPAIWALRRFFQAIRGLLTLSALARLLHP